MRAADLPAPVRERAMRIAQEIIRRRAKGFPAIGHLVQLGHIMERGGAHITKPLDEIPEFARALCANRETP